MTFRNSTAGHPRRLSLLGLLAALLPLLPRTALAQTPAERAYERFEHRQFQEAHDLYLRCWLDDKDNVSCLYNAARSALEVKQVDRAFCELTAALAARPDHVNARIQLDTLRQKWRAAGTLPARCRGFDPLERPVPRASWPGWLLVAGGAALGATAGGLALAASIDQAQLDADYKQVNSAGRIVGLTRQKAERRQHDIDGLNNGAWAVGTAATLAAAAGVWLLWPQSDVALAAGPDGVQIALRWR